MGLDLGAFVKAASQNPITKITGSSTSNLATSLATSLASAGLSSPSINSLISTATDSILSGAASEFFSQNSPGTSALSALTQGRFASSLNANTYSSTVNPDNKIASAANTGSQLTFPPDLSDYKIGFTFMEYSRPNPFEPATDNPISSIYLPIPSQLSESHGIDWQESGVDNILETLARSISGQKTAANEVNGAAATVFASMNDVLKGGTAVVGGMVGGPIGAVLAEKGASGLTEQVMGVIGQYAGAVPNPNLSVFFQGPTLREFSFTWKFYPHNPAESNSIKSIFNEFRKNMLPNFKFSGASNVLGYPNMLEMKLYPDDSYLYQAKKCVITAANFNYAPDGIPLFFEGTKAPKFIQLSITLKEIEYLTSEDFGGASGNGVGFDPSALANTVTTGLGL